MSKTVIIDYRKLTARPVTGKDLKDVIRAWQRGRLWKELSGAHVPGADLSRMNLSRFEVHGASLPSANLRGANMTRAYCVNSNFSCADFRGANMRGATFFGCDLRYAKLDGVDLSKTKLNRSNLGQIDAIIYAGDADGYTVYAFRKGKQVLVRAGCRCFTIAHAKRHWGTVNGIVKAHRRELRAAVDYIETVAKARGWIK